MAASPPVALTASATDSLTDRVRSTSGTVVGAGASPRSRLWVSRLIGALFLLGFVSYGVGSALANSVVGGAGFLPRVSA